METTTLRQPKPRPRKRISVRCIPSGGQYQLIMLTGIHGNILPHFPKHYPMLGPFLYDVTNQRITVFSYRRFEVSKLIEDEDSVHYVVDKRRKRRKKRWWGYEYSYSTSEENDLIHNVAYGDLHTFDGTYIRYDDIDDEASYPEGEVKWTSHLSRLLAMTQGGQLLDHAITYALGTSQPYDYFIPIYTTDRFKQIVSLSGDNAEHAEWIDGTYIVANYLLDRTMTLTPELPYIINKNVDGTFSLKWHIRSFEGGNVVADCYDTWFHHAIAISPIMVSLADYGSETFTGYDLLKSRIQEQLDSVVDVIPKHHQFKACLDAVDGIRTTQINGISFMKELTEIKTLFEPFIEMLVERKWLSPKAWAGILLSIRYGWKLSIQDWIELYQKLKHIALTYKGIEEYGKFRNSLRTCYGTYKEETELPFGTVQSRSNCRVVLRWELPINGKLDAVMKLVEDMGLRLTASNVWDMIPFSFVVDWFTGIGATFQAWDFNLELDRLRLRERVSSLRNRVATSDIEYFDDFGLVGRIHFDTYNRSISNEFPEISYERDSPSFRKHTWEIFLLFVANGRGD